MYWKAPEGRHAVRRHSVSPLRGLKTRFDDDFLGLTPQAICCRRSAADLRNLKTHAAACDGFETPSTFSVRFAVGTPSGLTTTILHEFCENEQFFRLFEKTHTNPTRKF